MADPIRIINARLAFPSLFEATSFNGEGDPAFSATFLIAKDDPQAETIRAAIKQIAVDKWGAKANDILADLVRADRVALHDGDYKSRYDGYQDHYYINASNKVRPKVVDQKTNPLNQADGKPYSGCYVNASIELWVQDNKYGKRINASLRGVQFVKDGEPFSGGGVASDDEFEALEATEDALW